MTQSRKSIATWREGIVRVWGQLRHGRRDGDLEEELRAHLEIAADDAGRQMSLSARTARR